MCEAGKVGIWLTPEEAKVIVSTLNLLTTRIEAGTLDYMSRLMDELDAITKASEKPNEEEEVDEEKEQETTELLPIIKLPPADDDEEPREAGKLTYSQKWGG